MIYPWVKKYIGIPFISGGRVLGGCDCYGLVRLVLKSEYGIYLPELSGDYKDARNVNETLHLFKKKLPVLTAARICEAEEKAVIVIREAGHPCHIGIYAGGGHILHSRSNTGSICQRLSHPGLRGSIEGYYRVC